MLDRIEFRDAKQVPADRLHALFIKEQWCDYMDLEDVEFYVESALYIVTAWLDEDIIGFARLGGDGRIDVEITDVLIRSDLQGKGIGTEMVRRLVDRIRQLDPYYIQVCPVGDREVHLYGKFGFTEMPDNRRMELINPKLARKIAQVRGSAPDS